MKSLFWALLFILSPLTSLAQAMQIAEITIHSANDNGAVGSTSGIFAAILYSKLITEELPYQENGLEKTWKNGQDYYCTKTLNTLAPDVQCHLFFANLKSLPHPEFIISIRFDIESETMTGYSLNAEINQILIWNVTAGRIIN
ncbi:hypothetical protein [Bdellovibrio sp. HCB209]|uniref:hypothetical protein n=1 Tax=Bdellovibrio sp. HCB209 TaxID=3394354 RepID=UPI0039B5360F